MPAATTGLVMRELNIALVPYRLVFALGTPFMAALGRFLVSPGNPKYWEMPYSIAPALDANYRHDAKEPPRPLAQSLHNR
jgi:hypothetical protein